MLCDAHNHLHDERLAPHREEILARLRELPLHCAMLNGTRPEDWPAVARWGAQYEWARVSFGLHPWHVAARPADWLESLRRFLLQHPGAGLGEIGLDRWIKGHDLRVQSQVFSAQLHLAAELDRPATIHCLQAWGALWETVHNGPRLARGFLLHAYGGPEEMTAGFLDCGAYFSFSPSFLHERKARQRDVFRHLPLERLLVETDAPDLRPPDERNPHPLCSPEGEPLNHPANLAVAYAGLAEVRGLRCEELEPIIAANFRALFGMHHSMDPAFAAVRAGSTCELSMGSPSPAKQQAQEGRIRKGPTSPVTDNDHT